LDFKSYILWPALGTLHKALVESGHPRRKYT
jgi:hypothetical protein